METYEIHIFGFKTIFSTRGKYVFEGKEERFTAITALVFFQCAVNYLYALIMSFVFPTKVCFDLKKNQIMNNLPPGERHNEELLLRYLFLDLPGSHGDLQQSSGLGQLSHTSYR